MRVLVYSHLALLVLCVLLSGARRAAAGAWCLFSPDSDAISSTPRCDGIPRLADKISGPQRRSPPSASVRQQQAAVGSTRYTNQADIRVEEVIVRNGNWTVVFLKDWKIELRLNNERMNMIDFGDKVSTLARTYGATSMVFLDDYIEMLYNSSVRLRAEYDWGFPMERMELGSDGNLRFFTTADGRNDSNGKPLPNRVAYTMTSIRNVHFPDYNTFFRKPVRGELCTSTYVLSPTLIRRRRS
ncbi:hypothetical protein DFJ74DRAFT_730248 [Hyaloraphidium curvatum]|nr:hypothetical protein DFJ74DRAFT_730248 [Hyaloraphidium curvatum]